MREIVLLAAVLATLPALAQNGHEPPRMPMKPDFAAALSISPEKAAQVEAVMQRERDKLREVHEATRAELSKILSADELARLEALRPRGPRAGGPPPRHGPPPGPGAS